MCVGHAPNLGADPIHFLWQLRHNTGKSRLGWLLAGDPLVRQMRREFARLEHFPDNVAAAKELAFDVKLRDRRPVGKILDSLADLVARKTIHRLI